LDCEDCTTGRNLYSPACLQCGARYLRAVQDTRRLPDAEKADWLRKILADWMAFGHPEQELRARAAALRGKRNDPRN